VDTQVGFEDILHIVGLDVLSAVVMNVAIFCVIVPCSAYVNRCFGGIY
jgi:hypothetical protein